MISWGTAACTFAMVFPGHNRMGAKEMAAVLPPHLQTSTGAEGSGDRNREEYFMIWKPPVPLI